MEIKTIIKFSNFMKKILYVYEYSELNASKLISQKSLYIFWNMAFVCFSIQFLKTKVWANFIFIVWSEKSRVEEEAL